MKRTNRQKWLPWIITTGICLVLLGGYHLNRRQSPRGCGVVSVNRSGEVSRPRYNTPKVAS